MLELTQTKEGRCHLLHSGYDTPGFHVRRVVHTLRSAHYATELQFVDMRVPDENILGRLTKVLRLQMIG
ncbi:MAG: hypothetical protein Ct9H90mP27_7560 [Gammaproteobacteria bacterium]|nr:MAG: hypothetical protein Ct9H90mP27_7560 [Gammaproteobacteria bacterium]